MDERMELIHASNNLAEIGVVKHYQKYDADITLGGKLENNTFELAIDSMAWDADRIVEGDYIYVAGREWGGPVERIKHDTGAEQMWLSGATWRGLFARKVVSPPAGEDYFIVPSMEANQALAYLVGDALGDFVVFETSSTGKLVNGSYRYKTLIYCIEHILNPVGLRFFCRYNSNSKKLHIGAEQVRDMSSLVDLSQDYGVSLVSTDGRIDGYNHIIALGRGELSDRTVINLYRLEGGTIVDEKPESWDDTIARTVVYDYSAAETEVELRRGAMEKMREYAADRSIEMDANAISEPLMLGDVVTARDRLTGLQAIAQVSSVNFVIDENGSATYTKTETLAQEG